MNLKKLFESLDENVFTTDLVESLELQFNEAVDEKAKLIAEERIEDEIEDLNLKSELHIDTLTEKADEYIEMKQSAMVDTLDKYLERIVEEFVTEAKDLLAQSLKTEQADMIIEAFDAMLTATGVEVAQIVEAKDESGVESKLDESKEKHDRLVEEIISLTSENEELIRMGVISEMVEGLTIVEAEKFKKLSNLVEFTRDDKYAEKLQTIKESVKGNTNYTKPDDLNENTNNDEKPSWSHLV